MSTLGWIALVLVVLAVALVLWMMARRARGSVADSPRTVADLVRLRAERAEAAEPEAAPSHAVVVPEPRSVVEEVPAEAEPVDEVPPAAEGRHAAPVRVPASADDTPWNRAARIAENAGIVWATDHSRPGRPEDAVPSEPVLRPVRLPAFPPDLVATRTTMPPAVAEPAALEAATATAEPGCDEGAVGTASVDVVGAAGPVGAPEAVAEPEPAEVVAAEPAVVEPTPAEPAVPEPVAAVPELEAVQPEFVGSASVGPGAAESAGGQATPIAAESVRARRSPAETAAEQAAADLALLRTFGCADPADSADDPSTVLLEGACCAAAASEAVPGAAQTVAFHVVGRDGAGVPSAGVTLLDDRGGEAAGAVADAHGRGTVLAPHPGSYVLVSAANGHQPGAVAITVAGESVSADLLLARSASLSGTVHGEDGPVVGARLTLVQDGEIVDTAQSGPGGAYRIADLAAGEYGLSVTAAECEPAAVLVTVPDETELVHDVELPLADQHHGSVPSWPAGGGALGIRPDPNRPADDLMIGLL